jgi:hypothetical protein
VPSHPHWCSPVCEFILLLLKKQPCKHFPAQTNYTQQQNCCTRRDIPKESRRLVPTGISSFVHFLPLFEPNSCLPFWPITTICVTCLCNCLFDGYISKRTLSASKMQAVDAMKIVSGNRITWTKPALMPLCPPKIPRGLI